MRGAFERREGRETDIIAKVEEAHSEAAEDDGEMQPGEERALVGKGDFGLYSYGERYALCGGALE